MKYFVWGVIILMWTSAWLFIGWILGSRVTSRQIASAIANGELSVQQRVESIAEQIESGIYIPVSGKRGPLR
jgi:hypothetical protein